MNVTQITFSPTGGTAQVAELITRSWGMPVHKIDLSNAQTAGSFLSLGKGDLAIIAIPSYGDGFPVWPLKGFQISTETRLRASWSACMATGRTKIPWLN